MSEPTYQTQEDFIMAGTAGCSGLIEALETATYEGLRAEDKDGYFNLPKDELKNKLILLAHEVTGLYLKLG